MLVLCDITAELLLFLVQDEEISPLPALTRRKVNDQVSFEIKFN